MRVRTVTAIAVLALIALLPAQAGARGARTHFTTCHFKGLEQEHLGPSYVTSLKVSGVSCASGVKLVKAYYRCRVRASGVKGRCRSTVLGYRCSERREGISVQFDAKVTCSSGRRVVVHTYTQDT